MTTLTNPQTHQLWLVRKMEVLYRGATAPSSSRLYARLFTGTLNYGSTATELIAAELEQSNGYTPQAITVGAASWDGTNKRATVGSIGFNFSASGSGYSWQTLCLWADCPSGGAANASISSVTNASSRVAVTGHAVTNGDAIMITADSGGTLPTGISGTTVYYGKSIDANTVEVYTDSGLTTLATMSNAGTLPLRLRYARGTPVAIANAATSQTIAAGNTWPFSINNFVELDSGVIVGN